MQDDRAALEDAIEIIQEALYLWITKPGKGGKRAFKSLFDLIGSYQQDAGIVICTGKGSFRWTIHQIVTIRLVLNSTLPIEIFYCGEDDLPERYRNFIQFIQSAFSRPGAIVTIDITKKFPDSEGMLSLCGGSAIRPYAILASSFKTVILAEADTVFLQDPRILLDEPSFEEYGSIFWHDRIFAPRDYETYIWADKLLETAKS